MSVERAGRGRAVGRPASASKRDVLVVARRSYIASERLDLQSVAAELGLSRATIYRWFGSREGLMGAVLASELEMVFDDVDARHRHRGAARLLEVMDGVVRILAGDGAFRRYLENESMSALRILTSSAGEVQPRAVIAVSGLVARAEAEDGYRPTVDRSTLAYALVRLTEAFLYNDAAAGIKGDVERLYDVIAALLGLDARAARTTGRRDSDG